MRKEVIKIIGLFLAWKLLLIVSLAIAINLMPLGYKDRYLGGGLSNYTVAPNVYSWANFDGEHYLSIAIIGYKGLEQAFFPVYPLLVAFLAHPFFYDFYSALLYSTLIGILISNLSLLLALVILFDLLRIDYSKRISFLTLVLILVFPTSFFLGAVYSESIFLLISVASFYSARKGHWLIASLLGALASATRIFGILLLPAFILEAIQQKAPLRNWFWIMLIPLGLLSYMYYQWISVGDPFAFYHLQKIVGEQHQSGVTTLPQVYFRYTKMLLSVDPGNPIFQTIALEFFVGVLFFALPIYGYFQKMRWSYIFFALTGFLAPTIQGSFSSVPRYVIVFFPSFLALAIWLDSKSKLIKGTIILLSILGLLVESILFLRGYWVS